ncbi:MAG TPA: hypothetical protein VF148_05330 [Acidimicrobiia bacterium]
MAQTQHGATRRPGMASTSPKLNYVIGVAVILIGALLVYSVVFTEFQHRVQFQWEVNNEGARVPITHITCPSPWSVITRDARPEGVVSGDLCVLPARGQVAQGVLIALGSLALALWALTRNPRTYPMPTLPQSIRERLWK